MKESVLDIACAGESLVGIVTEPPGVPAEVGVVILVGGPQYRAGSHRQFTLLARHLANHGFTALRFDYRGMGDSPGEARDFLDVGADICAAIDTLLAARPALRRVALWGLCDAASAALLYLASTSDSRVAGVALANPWVRSAATLAQTHVKHYYWRRLREKAFWLKLLRGGVGITALRALAGNLRLARSAAHAAPDKRSFQDRMAAGLNNFKGHLLLILSGNDYTAREFENYCSSASAWASLRDRLAASQQRLAQADHTFSDSLDACRVEHLTLQWLQTFRSL